MPRTFPVTEARIIMTTRTNLIAVFAAIAAVIVACESSTIVDPNSHFATSLSGPKEVPANAATGTGQAVVTLTPSGILSYNVTWTGLTGAYTDAHIHGPADSTGTA